MDRPSLIFCAVSLALTVAVSVVAFPFAARSRSAVEAAGKPVDADTLHPIDLGAFGVQPVSELLHYYLENPPAPAAGGAAPQKKHRFGGC